MEYRLAPEVGRVAKELIAEHHRHLLNVEVVYVFLSKTPKNKGKDVWGRAKKVSGLPAFLASRQQHDITYEEQADDLFVIEISEEVWERLKPKARRALVDHELSHCWVIWDEKAESDSLSVIGHDVAEFEAILKRHGLWNDDVEDFVRTGFEQLSFDKFVEENGAPKAEGEATAEGEGDKQIGHSLAGETFSFDRNDLETIGTAGEHLRSSE